MTRTTRQDHGDQHGHGHRHDHGRHDHGRHGHDHTRLDDEVLTRRDAVRALWISVAGLGATAALQLGIVAISGSAGLYADALHNIGDVAGTAALWVGFRLSRRPASDRFPYGWRRAEDLAGLVILLAIAVSAGLAGWDSFAALLAEGHVVRNPAAALAAALVGALGNEAVAIYKIRVGRRIDSVPLVADGKHARVDGLVSLGAALGIAGAWAGWSTADPLAGLAITMTIVVILVRTSREVLARNLDAVDPGLIQRVRRVVLDVAGVEDVHDVRARHAGRSLLIQLHADVDGSLPLVRAHAIAEEIRHRVAHALPAVHAVDVHLDPAGDPDAHQSTSHHFGPSPEP